MKRRIKYKNLISLILVLILLVALCIPSSYALDTSKRRFGAMIMSALQAINITMQSTLAPAQDMLDAIADPPGYVGIYEYPWEPDWDNEILDRSSIQIWPDYTEIDGVKYTDVWLSNEAAEKFRVNAFDWKTAYSIASNSNGTYLSGDGHYGDLPLYSYNSNYTQTQYFLETPGTYSNRNYYDTGPLQNEIYNTTSGNSKYLELGYKYDDEVNYSHAITFNGRTTPAESARVQYRVGKPGTSGANKIFMSVYDDLNNFKETQITYRSGLANFTPFDFDYVAGTIPADQILPSDTGMMIRVPSDTQGLETFIENNINFTNEGGVNLDFDLHPELKVSVDDLLDILAPIIPVINTGDIQFTVNHTDPTPPIPDTPIIDATVPQVVNPIINEITNYGDQITEQIPQIIETIPTIDSICENIDTAPYHDLDTGLDKLPTIFLPFITDLRSALGIWHYVTEWLSQISSTFAFVSGCLVGTSIMTPIYAAIAGFMCIKIYRRMTA